MKKIWKFKLRVVDYQEILLPKGSEIIAVNESPEIVMSVSLWAAVPANVGPDWEHNPDQRETRMIRIFPTGNAVVDLDRLTHLATVVTSEVNYTKLVWHVFEASV